MITIQVDQDGAGAGTLDTSIDIIPASSRKNTTSDVETGDQLSIDLNASTNNVAWEVSSNVPWLVPSLGQGFGPETVTVQVGPAPGDIGDGDPEGTITVTSDNTCFNPFEATFRVKQLVQASLVVEVTWEPVSGPRTGQVLPVQGAVVTLNGITPQPTNADGLVDFVLSNLNGVTASIAKTGYETLRPPVPGGTNVGFLPVTLQPSRPFLFVEADSIDLPGEGGSALDTIELINESDVGALSPVVSASPDDGWLSWTVSPEVITLSATRNDPSGERTTTLLINDSNAINGQASVTVRQEVFDPGPILEASRAPLSFPAASTGQTRTIAISNIGTRTLEWTASATQGQAWLSVSPGSGQQAGTVTLTAAPNGTLEQRLGSVRITGTNATNGPIDVAVSQAGRDPTPPVLTVSPQALGYVASGEQKSVSIGNAGEAELSWTATVVTPDAGWLTLGASQGTGPASLNVTASQNTSLEARQAVVRIIGTNAANGPIDVAVTQAGREPFPASITVMPLALNFGANGGDESVSIGNAGEEALQWSAAVSPGADWLRITPTSGQDDGSISVSADPNTTLEPRQATVSVSDPNADNSPVIVQVSQAADVPEPILIVAPVEIDFGANGSTTVLSISNGGTGTLEWSLAVASEDGWLSADQLQGTGNAAITLTAQPNTAFEERMATITVSS